VPDLLDRGELDLAIGSFEETGGRFDRASLIEDTFVVAMRADHPAGRHELTAAAFAGLAHLEISSSGENTGFVDEWLAGQGGARRIPHRAPYLAAARIIAGSDMVTVLSRRIAEAFVRTEGLWVRDLPWPPPRMAIAMSWRRRLDNQPAHRWLRRLIETACILRSRSAHGNVMRKAAMPKTDCIGQRRLPIYRTATQR
jgi:DNA-binding transcriptional LysR family regulator